ncbi:MAG TPA: hypothetical protein DD734_04515 [Firmicutes bacterium]|nr:hypothetical protein [Bacillota bacterium]
MASKAQTLNDSGNKVAVFTDIGGTAASVKLTLVDVETGQVVPVAGITAIKVLRDFLDIQIRKADFDEVLDREPGLRRSGEGS